GGVRAGHAGGPAPGTTAVARAPVAVSAAPVAPSTGEREDDEQEEQEEQEPEAREPASDDDRSTGFDRGRGQAGLVADEPRDDRDEPDEQDSEESAAHGGDLSICRGPDHPGRLLDGSHTR